MKTMARFRLNRPVMSRVVGAKLECLRLNHMHDSTRTTVDYQDPALLVLLSDVQLYISGQLTPLCQAANRYTRQPTRRKAAPSLRFGSIADLKG